MRAFRLCTDIHKFLFVIVSPWNNGIRFVKQLQYTNQNYLESNTHTYISNRLRFFFRAQVDCSLNSHLHKFIQNEQE